MRRLAAGLVGLALALCVGACSHHHLHHAYGEPHQHRQGGRAEHNPPFHVHGEHHQGPGHSACPAHPDQYHTHEYHGWLDEPPHLPRALKSY